MSATKFFSHRRKITRHHLFGTWPHLRVPVLRMAAFWLPPFQRLVKMSRPHKASRNIFCSDCNLHINGCWMQWLPTDGFACKHLTELDSSNWKCALWGTETVQLLHIVVVDLKFNKSESFSVINPLNAELNPICCLLALLGAHHFLHVSRIRVKSLTLRLLMSYIYIWSTHSWCF